MDDNGVVGCDWATSGEESSPAENSRRASHLATSFIRVSSLAVVLVPSSLYIPFFLRFPYLRVQSFQNSFLN